MQVLFFFPWMHFLEPVQVGCIRLTPYFRGASPGAFHGVRQAVLDNILAAYGEHNHFYVGIGDHSIATVREALLISWSDDVDGLEVPEEQIDIRRKQTNYIGFSALAKRKFCTSSEYTNADHFTVVAQPFRPESSDGVAIFTRRRDGSCSQYLGLEQGPRIIRPFHIQDKSQLIFDSSLAEALLALAPGDLKDRIDESIAIFLLANTDDPAMNERSEVVLTRIAFDLLLGSKHTVEDFMKRLLTHFEGDLPSPPLWSKGPFTEDVWRDRWYKPEKPNKPGNKVSRPLEAWALDFAGARNDAAHGSKAAYRPPVWTNKYHLLYASWLFPLMVKKLLEGAGSYQMTDQDKLWRRHCERFIGPDLLQHTDESKRDFWWAKIERTIRPSM